MDVSLIHLRVAVCHRDATQVSNLPRGREGLRVSHWFQVTSPAMTVVL